MRRLLIGPRPGGWPRGRGQPHPRAGVLPNFGVRAEVSDRRETRTGPVRLRLRVTSYDQDYEAVAVIVTRARARNPPLGAPPTQVPSAAAVHMFGRRIRRATTPAGPTGKTVARSEPTRRQSESLEQFGHRDPQRFGKLPDRFDGHRLLATLHLADVNRVEIRLLGKLLLTESRRGAAGANVFAQPLADSLDTRQAPLRNQRGLAAAIA